MKKLTLITTVLVMVVFVALSFAGAKAKMALKVGDEIFACDCGVSCPCKTMSKNPGNCTCDKEMVKAKVTKVDGNNIMLKADSWDKERPFKATGKYACGCSPEGNCDTISQSPGKSNCKADMKKM